MSEGFLLHEKSISRFFSRRNETFTDKNNDPTNKNTGNESSSIPLGTAMYPVEIDDDSEDQREDTTTTTTIVELVKQETSCTQTVADSLTSPLMNEIVENPIKEEVTQ